MLSRTRMAAAIVLVGACYGALAVDAAAKPTPLLPAHYRPLPMLPVRSCGGLLGIGSFPGAAAEEINPTVKTASGSGSICVFMPHATEAQEAAGERAIGGGGLTLNVYNRITYEFRGKERNIASAVPFPHTARRDPVKIGSHAYVGVTVEPGDVAQEAFGVAQVRNDVAIVAVELTPADYAAGDPTNHVELLLKSVISDLCPHCRA
jgi:hypothetical protein